MSLTPQQKSAAIELVSRATRINCFEEAALLIDAIEGLLDIGIPTVDIIRWVTILPRVKDRASALANAPLPDPAQLSLLPGLDDLPHQMQRAIRPAVGTVRVHTVGALLDPDTASLDRVRGVMRPTQGVCSVCAVVFVIEPGRGRPPTKCDAHRENRRKAS